MVRFRTIKKEIRILAWDDGPFEFGAKGKDILVGVIYRGGSFMDGLLRTDIDVDGNDAEEKIIDAVNKSRHKDIRVMMLDGITFAGFNTVNIKNIYEKTNLPVLAVLRKVPNFGKFKAILEKLPHAETRLKCVKDAGEVFSVKVSDKKIYYQCYGIEIKDVEQIIKISSLHGNIPEPLRIAHLIATGIVLGESVGRA